MTDTQYKALSIKEFSKAARVYETDEAGVYTLRAYAYGHLPAGQTNNDGSDIWEELIGELELLEPFGKGNEKPVFAERGLHPVRAAVIGKNQNVLKFQMESTDGVRMEALYFGDPREMLEYLSVRYSHAEVERMLQGRENAVRMDVLYYPSVNEFRGMRTIQIVITGYR